MIYVTGDCHGDFSRFSGNKFRATESDTVIICGDFGGIWSQTESKYEKWWLDWLNEKPFTTVFVDGNHENFDRLNSYPVKIWNGGKVHEIRSKIFHLMRGEIFTIEGKKFFAFGGASSHDIQDGILEPDQKDLIKEWNKSLKMFRVKNVSWWKQELPTNEEMENGIRNLEAAGWKVDYIITHSPTASQVALLGQGLYSQDKLTYYLQDIASKTEYCRHFFGHMHDDRWINEKDILLYEKIVPILNNQ